MSIVARDALLPGNATAFEDAQSQTSARILDTDVATIRRQRSPADCAAPFLPLLGFERSVHHWSQGDAGANRAAVARAFDDHLGYGTPAALEAEIALDVAFPVVVRDFFEAGLAWPDFLVVVTVPNAVDPPHPGAVWASALRRKNVRDMPVVIYAHGESGPLFVAASLRIAGTIQILPADPWPRIPAAVAYAAALRLIGTYNVRPFA